jgi:hypothetical protein
MVRLKRNVMDLSYEERVVLLEERAIALGMSQGPRLLEVVELKNDIRRIRMELHHIYDLKRARALGKRLDGVVCEAIATVQKWIENAPAERAAA